MSTKTLIGPKIKTSLPGPNAKRIIGGDDKYISPSYTRSYPMVAKQARGIVVIDVDGNEFFDFSAGIAVTSTGHCHPEVVAAIQRQSAELIHMSGTDFYYESMVTLAERLSKIAPMPGPHKPVQICSAATNPFSIPPPGASAGAVSDWPAPASFARPGAVYRFHFLFGRIVWLP